MTCKKDPVAVQFLVMDGAAKSNVCDQNARDQAVRVAAQYGWNVPYPVNLDAQNAQRWDAASAAPPPVALLGSAAAALVVFNGDAAVTVVVAAVFNGAAVVKEGPPMSEKREGFFNGGFV